MSKVLYFHLLYRSVNSEKYETKNLPDILYEGEIVRSPEQIIVLGYSGKEKCQEHMELTFIITLPMFIGISFNIF